MTINEPIQESEYHTIHFEDDDYLYNQTYTDEDGCRHMDYISVKDLRAWYERMKEKQKSQKSQRT